MAEKEFVFKINGQQAANTIAGIQKQIKALDDTIANTNIKDPGFSDLVKESEKAKGSLKTLQTEGIAGLKPQGLMGQLKGFGKTLGEIPGPIGGVVGGINSMTAASLRFIATPIGAIIAALVLVFKAFQKGIESSEKAQQGLNKIMGAFSGIIGPVIKAVGEFAAVLIDGVVFAIDAVMSGLEALGVDFAENAKAGMALADTLNQIEEAEGDLEVARAQQNKTLAEAKELLSDTNAKYADRKKALDDIRASEEKLSAQEVDLAKKRVAAAKEDIRLYGESKEANDKLDAARIKLANTEEAFAAKKRQFNKEEKKLIAEAAATQKQADAEAEARAKEAAAKAKAYREERIKANDDARAIVERIALKELEDERNRLLTQEKFRADAERRTIERSTYNAKEKALLLALIEQEYNDNIKKIREDADAKELKRREELDKKLKQLRGENAQVEIEDEGKKYDELVKQVNESYVKKQEVIIDADETLLKASEQLAERRKRIEVSDGDDRIKLVEEQQAVIKEVLQGASDDEIEISEETTAKILTLEEEKIIALAQIEEERQKALARVRDKTLKDAADKALADLKKQQEAEFLIYKDHEEKLRDQVLNDKKATITQKEEAEKRYGENIRAEQEKQLNAQLELLKKGVYETEEAKKTSNLEILRLQDELNQNLKNKYEEDQLNFIDALNKKVTDFLKNNEDLIDQINGTLQAAQTVVDAFQAFQDLKNQEAYEKNKKASEDELALITANAEAALAVAGTTDEQKKKIKEDYNKAVAQAEYKRALGEYNIAKEAFDNGKKLQIASAIISTIQGAVQAFTSLSSIPVVGPILGGIAAAAALAAGYAQVATIRATTFSGTPPKDPSAALNQSGGEGGGSGSKFAQGGLLMGRKHAEGGINTPYGELEGGEFIVNRDATASFLPMLEKINSMGSGSGAPNNLSVSAEQGITPPAPIIKAYVVASDVSSQQEANKRISDLARL